jgi:hypothetical protein
MCINDVKIDCSKTLIMSILSIVCIDFKRGAVGGRSGPPLSRYCSLAAANITKGVAHRYFW